MTQRTIATKNSKEVHGDAQTQEKKNFNTPYKMIAFTKGKRIKLKDDSILSSSEASEDAMVPVNQSAQKVAARPRIDLVGRAAPSNGQSVDAVELDKRLRRLEALQAEISDLEVKINDLQVLKTGEEEKAEILQEEFDTLKVELEALEADQKAAKAVKKATSKLQKCIKVLQDAQGNYALQDDLRTQIQNAVGQIVDVNCQNFPGDVQRQLDIAQSNLLDELQCHKNAKSDPEAKAYYDLAQTFLEAVRGFEDKFGRQERQYKSDLDNVAKRCSRLNAPDANEAQEDKELQHYIKQNQGRLENMLKVFYDAKEQLNMHKINLIDQLQQISNDMAQKTAELEKIDISKIQALSIKK